MHRGHVADISQDLIAPCSYRGRTMAFLRASTFAAWFFMLVYNYWWLRDWDDVLSIYGSQESTASIKDYYYIGFAIAVTGHLTLGLPAWFSAPFKACSTFPGKLLTAFCMLMLITVPFSKIPQTSAIYAIATWGVFILCSLYWKSDYQTVCRALVLTGFVLFAWLIILLFHHGLIGGFGGVIGSLNRNITSMAGISAMICTTFSTKKYIRWGGFGLASFLALVVSSRGSLLALSVFFVVYFALHKGMSKALGYAVIAFFLFLPVVLISPQAKDAVFEKVMKLHDKDRGLGSGFTGRTESWKHGINLFLKRPVLGYGFRSSSMGHLGGIHGGYIQIFVEAGAIGGMLLVAAIGTGAFLRVKTAWQFLDESPDIIPGVDRIATRHLNAIAGGTFCLTMTVWVYEPLYVNIGSVISILFFLMMAAPVYVRESNMQA